jgi:hypothetical protein
MSDWRIWAAGSWRSTSRWRMDPDQAEFSVADIDEPAAVYGAVPRPTRSQRRRKSKLRPAGRTPVPAHESDAALLGNAGPITKPIVASAGDQAEGILPRDQPGDEPWRVHFVDLTVPDPAPDMDVRRIRPCRAPRPPTRTSAALCAMPDCTSPTTGSMGARWSCRSTIRPDRDAGSICEALSARDDRSPACRKSHLSDPIGIRSNSATARPTRASGHNRRCRAERRIFHDSYHDRFAARLDPEIARGDRGATFRSSRGLPSCGTVLEVEIENLSDICAMRKRSAGPCARSPPLRPPNITAFRVTTSIDQMPLTTVTMSRTEIDALGNSDRDTRGNMVIVGAGDASPSTDYGNGRGFPAIRLVGLSRASEGTFRSQQPHLYRSRISGSTHTELLPGLVLDDEATYSIWNNFASITRTATAYCRMCAATRRCI